MVSRTLLAAVLGIGIGLVCFAFPGAVVRTQTAGRLPHDSGGEYGTSTPSKRWTRIVRVVGAVAVAFGVYLVVDILIGI